MVKLHECQHCPEYTSYVKSDTAMQACIGTYTPAEMALYTASNIIIPRAPGVAQPINDQDKSSSLPYHEILSL